MPENTLIKDSSPVAIRSWISMKIKACMDEPMRPGMTDENKSKMCAAIAYSEARKATGQDIGEEA
jgi:hypothetical protein